MAEAAKATTAAKKATKKTAAPPQPETNGDENEPGKRALARARKITLLAKENPKREGTASFDRFKLYKTGMTIQQYLDAGGTMGDIAWDQKNEYIKLSD
jgi:hypothetical protein